MPRNHALPTLFIALLTVTSLATAAVPAEGQEQAQETSTTPLAKELQALAETRPSRLRVYLDCFDCFSTFLRDEIGWVDFVREPQDADVNLLSASRGTGSGGREVVLRFIGRGRFEGIDHELRTFSDVGEPENLQRQAVLRTVSVGLLDYLAHEGLLDGFDVTVGQNGQVEEVAPPRDPWDLWVFRLSAGGSMDAEETNRELQWDMSVSGDRVTEAWKISFGAESEQQRETFDLDDDDPFRIRRVERSFDWFVARGLGPHWSVGIDGRVESSTFDNIGFSAQSAPAIEYSVFPYRDYATRQVIIQYEVGLERARYNEVTLFDRTEETLWRQQLSARLDQRQPWGSLRANVRWSQYLHDRTKYQVQAGGQVSLRITRGLSLDLQGSASRIRDQLSLPRRTATSEEVLLRIRDLQSGYEVGFGFGVSYSFGSIFNNVVNPRFGGGGQNFF